MGIPLFLRALIGLAMVAPCLAFFSSDAGAISRYTSTAMTCASIKAAIRKGGAAHFRWTSSMTGNNLYGRYVVNENFCLPGETTSTIWIPSSDRKQCAVDQCVSRSQFDELK